MAALIELREHTAGKLDFDHMARSPRRPRAAGMVGQQRQCSDDRRPDQGSARHPGRHHPAAAALSTSATHLQAHGLLEQPRQLHAIPPCSYKTLSPSLLPRDPIYWLIKY